MCTFYVNLFKGTIYFLLNACIYFQKKLLLDVSTVNNNNNNNNNNDRQYNIRKTGVLSNLCILPPSPSNKTLKRLLRKIYGPSK